MNPNIVMESMEARHLSNRGHANRDDLVPYPRINAEHYDDSPYPRYTREPANPFSRLCNYHIRPEVEFEKDLTRPCSSLNLPEQTGSDHDGWNWDVPAFRQSIFNTAEYNAKFSHV